MDSLPVQQEDPHPIGGIAEIHGPVVIIDCTRLPPLRQALCTRFDHTVYLFEVHQHLDERRVRAVTLHGTASKGIYPAVDPLRSGSRLMDRHTLDALARQPESEQSIMRTLFIGLAMIESLAIYCLVIILIVLFKNPLLEFIAR